MNLLSKLHKNSILTGPIESYCLACGCLLRSEEESYQHIHLPHHVDKLQALPHLDGYKDDCIIKIKEGYFCPYCNIILPTIKRISLHVVEPKHKENKIAQSITRHADTIFLFDIVVIDPRSWHGVDGTTCSVCNEDYADEKEHTNEPGHALKLIQAKCEFGDNYVYRNIDEELFFCLICKKILPITEQESHSQNNTHLGLYKKSSIEGAAIKSKKTSELNNNIAEEKSDSALPEVELKDSNTNDKSMKDSKDTNNIEKQENKVYNGSPGDIDDYRATVKTDSQEFNPNNVNLNTENAQTPHVLKYEPTDKTQSAKVSTQIKESLIQETLKINPPPQDNKVILKSNEDTSKVNDNIKNQNNEPRNTQDQNGVNESKDSNEKAQETTEIIEAQTNELKDATTLGVMVPKVPETKTTETAKPASVKSDTNGTAKVPKSAEPYLYEFLKSRNFVIRTVDGEAFCTLCDVSVDVAEIAVHCIHRHHNILYQKHIDRKNKLTEKSRQDTAKEEATKKIGTDKVSQATESAIEKTKAKKTANKIQPIETSTNNVDKVAKVEESTDKNDQVVQKENVAEGKVGNEHISVSQPTTAKNKPSREKSTKKAKRKASKARTALLGSQSEKIGETVLDDVKPCDTALDVSVNEKAIETNGTSINGKTAETNEISDTVSDKAIDKNDISINENEKATEIPEITHPETVNGTENGTMAGVNPKTENLLAFIKTISQVNSTPEDVVINCKYVVGNLSFVLLVRTGGKVECVACNEKLTVDVHKHIATEEHRINFEDCPVVTSLDEEFIRQVKTEKYHCGYCNTTLADWCETKAHLDTYQHTDAKTSATWRLERYLPHMKHCEKKEVRSILTAVFRRIMD